MKTDLSARALIEMKKISRQSRMDLFMDRVYESAEFDLIIRGLAGLMIADMDHDGKIQSRDEAMADLSSLFAHIDENLDAEIEESNRLEREGADLDYGEEHA